MIYCEDCYRTVDTGDGDKHLYTGMCPRCHKHWVAQLKKRGGRYYRAYKELLKNPPKVLGVHVGGSEQEAAEKWVAENQELCKQIG